MQRGGGGGGGSLVWLLFPFGVFVVVEGGLLLCLVLLVVAECGGLLCLLWVRGRVVSFL